jgi:uncharacterized protein YecT (DUF1311 family)
MHKGPSIALLRHLRIVAVLSALAVLGSVARAGDAGADDQILLRPQATKIPSETVDKWKQDCAANGTPRACYNVAVDYAQSQGNEPKAVEYLRPLCKRSYLLGCFNLGGILIKEKSTRGEGLMALRRACSLAKAGSGTEKENAATLSSCSIADVVEKYQDREYTEIAAQLGLGPAVSRGAEHSPPKCAEDEVPWHGRCFSRYEFDPGDPSCPDGIIVIPDGEDVPRCVRCEDYEDGRQQPDNYCSGMAAERADTKMKATFDDLVKRAPARERELGNAQTAWLKKRDATCRREGKEYEGGSMQPQVVNECLLQRTLKRIDELARMAPLSSSATAPAVGPCGGRPGGQLPVDRCASVVVDKSHFQDEPENCPTDGSCPWRRKGYVVRGDDVVETAVNGNFACVKYKSTSGWLPRGDLWESGAPCDAKSKPQSPSQAHP